MRRVLTSHHLTPPLVDYAVSVDEARKALLPFAAHRGDAVRKSIDILSQGFAAQDRQIADGRAFRLVEHFLIATYP